MLLHDDRLMSMGLIEAEREKTAPEGESRRASPFPGICAVLVVLILAAVIAVAVLTFRASKFAAETVIARS